MNTRSFQIPTATVPCETILVKSGGGSTLSQHLLQDAPPEAGAFSF